MQKKDRFLLRLTDLVSALEMEITGFGMEPQINSFTVVPKSETIISNTIKKD